MTRSGATDYRDYEYGPEYEHPEIVAVATTQKIRQQLIEPTSADHGLKTLAPVPNHQRLLNRASAPRKKPHPLCRLTRHE